MDARAPVSWTSRHRLGGQWFGGTPLPPSSAEREPGPELPAGSVAGIQPVQAVQAALRPSHTSASQPPRPTVSLQEGTRTLSPRPTHGQGPASNALPERPD